MRRTARPDGAHPRIDPTRVVSHSVSNRFVGLVTNIVADTAITQAEVHCSRHRVDPLMTTQGTHAQMTSAASKAGVSCPRSSGTVALRRRAPFMLRSGKYDTLGTFENCDNRASKGLSLGLRAFPWASFGKPIA